MIPIYGNVYHTHSTVSTCKDNAIQVLLCGLTPASHSLLLVSIGEAFLTFQVRNCLSTTLWRRADWLGSFLLLAAAYRFLVFSFLLLMYCYPIQYKQSFLTRGLLTRMHSPTHPPTQHDRHARTFS